MRIRISESYRAIIEKARWSHENHRTVFHLETGDVERARLYAYAYRSQTIGAFHACREALAKSCKDGRGFTEHRSRAAGLLKQLEDLAITSVPEDFRAVVFTLYHYDQWISEVVRALEAECDAGHALQIQPIKDRFVANMERITRSNGIYVASDVVIPEQSSFIVPGLNISIVPLIYGDHVSWNFAHLAADSAGVATHRHRQGVEIHLGFSPVDGRTILGEHGAIVREGYAMPIPAGTYHGFDKPFGHEHFLPFIFGSLILSGWGVFFDVEPQPNGSARLFEVPLDSEQMNGSIYLERELRRMAGEAATRRNVLIPAAATRSGGAGGLELGIARVGRDGLTVSGQTYRILSVCRGRANIRIGSDSADLTARDHVGIPAGVEARIFSRGEAPLVTLDAQMV